LTGSGTREEINPCTNGPLSPTLDCEGFYLGHQEFFHAFAEVHLGSRCAAEEAVHEGRPAIGSGGTAQPNYYVDRSDVPEGKFAEVKNGMRDLAPPVAAREPQLIAYHFYVDESEWTEAGLSTPIA
jgi:hypothetical protein